MSNFVFALQEFLNAQFGAGLVQDGLFGTRSRAAASVLVSTLEQENWDQIPIKGGQASMFGGPADLGDLYEGQSFFPIVDPDGSGPRKAFMPPDEYYRSLDPELQKLLRPEMAQAKSWTVKGLGEVGVSYWLDTKEMYGAAQLAGEALKLAKAGVPIYFEVINLAIIENGKPRSVVIRICDWGPTKVYTKALVEMIKRRNPDTAIKVGDPWPYKIDLSPGAYDALGLTSKRNRVIWRMLPVQKAAVEP